MRQSSHENIRAGSKREVVDELFVMKCTKGWLTMPNPTQSHGFSF